MRYIIIVTLVVLVLAVGITFSAESKSGNSTHSTKWVSYNDPYGRYTIKYPSNWVIQTEPVHTEDYINDVPFEVCGTHNGITNQCVLVNQIANSAGFNAREVATNFQNDLERFSGPAQVVNPISCGYRNITESCQYGVLTGNVILKDAWEVVSYVDSANNAYVLLYVAYFPHSLLKGSDVGYILDSFSILSSSSSGVQTTSQQGILSDTFAECLLHHNCSQEDKKKVGQVNELIQSLPTGADLAKMVKEG